MVEREPHYRRISPDRLPRTARQPLHVVLENIRSAFNVGSIFRTADAAAAAHLHLCGYTAYPPNEKLAKTALGAMDYVPWTHRWEIAETLATLRDRGLTLVAIETTPDAVAHTAFDWPHPVAIVLGNEVGGITPATLAACDHVVQIPMRGFKNSVNVATAFGVVAYEILRRWGALPTGD